MMVEEKKVRIVLEAQPISCVAEGESSLLERLGILRLREEDRVSVNAWSGSGLSGKLDAVGRS